MIKGIDAEFLLADRGYDSDVIVKKAEATGMQTVIHPRKNRKEQRKYDEALYKLTFPDVPQTESVPAIQMSYAVSIKIKKDSFSVFSIRQSPNKLSN